MLPAVKRMADVIDRCSRLNHAARAMLSTRHTQVALKEDHMRKSVIPMAAAIVSMIGTQAYAAKYTCGFAKDNNPVGQQCSIDPTTANSSCFQPMGGNLGAACAAGKSDDDKLEALLCAFGTPTNLVEAMKSTVGSDQIAAFRALAEKSGFVAQNFSVFATGSRPLIFALAYRESQNSPVFTAVCN
jgi:hypothetical protein